MFWSSETASEVFGVIITKDGKGFNSIDQAKYNSNTCVNGNCLISKY